MTKEKIIKSLKEDIAIYVSSPDYDTGGQPTVEVEYYINDHEKSLDSNWFIFPIGDTDLPMDIYFYKDFGSRGESIKFCASMEDINNKYVTYKVEEM